MKPYVGVTGFKTKDEVNEIARMAEKIGYPFSHTVMFGYLASSKRLQNPFSGGKRSPAVADLASLVSSTPNWAISMIHYFTENKSQMLLEVDYLAKTTNANAVQLNIAWPNIADIEKLKEKNSSLQLLLQIPKRATQGLDIYQIVKKTKDYNALVDYVLIDPSGGEGKEFDMNESVELINELNHAMTHSLIGIAGGFKPENVSERIKTLNLLVEKEYFIDAETGIMTNNSLDMNKVNSYLQKSYDSLK
jgi:phosphoribosylanthranilate isomerase